MGIGALLGFLKSSSSSSSHLTAAGGRIMEPGQLPLALDSESKSTSLTQTKCYPLQFVTARNVFHRFFSSLTMSKALASSPCCTQPDNGDDKGDDNESRIELGMGSHLYVYNSPDSAGLKSTQRNSLINILFCISAAILLSVELYKLAAIGHSGVLRTTFGLIGIISTLGPTGIICTASFYVNHEFFSPHVHQLRWQPGSEQFEVDKLSWCGMSTTRTIKFSDIRPPPQTDYDNQTFLANGESYHLSDPQVYQMLMTGKFPDEFPEVSGTVLSEDAGHIAS